MRRRLLGSVAAFEFRYQVASPLFAVAAALLFAGAFVDMAVHKILSSGGGNVLFNSPHAIIVSHLLVSFVFLFLGAAFVADVVVRDDRTGFGPILRSTGVGNADYLLGRFGGAFAAGALAMAAATGGAWLGTLMPFADQAMLGPNRVAGFAYGYGFFALPNAFIVSAVLFALATATRSTAGTFVGVVGLLFFYLFSQRLMEGVPQLLTFRVLADPLGMSAYMASARYLTAAELNAGAVPVTGLMLLSRLLWMGIATLLLASICRLFRFADGSAAGRRPRTSGRRVAGSSAEPIVSGAALARLPQPRFGARTARAQFAARTAMEARYILKSPVFLILMLVAVAFTLPSLMTVSGWFGVPLYPITSIAAPTVESSFNTVLLIIATFYGGELVWRERERRVNEIVDATPLPAWALMLPKLLALVLVLFATQMVGVAVGVSVQWMRGVSIAPGDWLRWYLAPAGVDAVLLAVLAVFIQAISPSKFAGWGLMVLYILLRTFGSTLGLAHPLLIYGGSPAGSLSAMAGLGNAAAASWWFRLFWASIAALLLIGAQSLWRRGTDARLLPRLRRLPALATGWTGAVVLVPAILAVLTGGWIVYNTLVLNDVRTGEDEQRYLAEYERRFFRYALLPQPTVRHVELDVALYPGEVRAEVRGRYRLVNETQAPINRVHVRLMDRELALLGLDFLGARLERDDWAFGYRIYRLDSPMRPGEARTIAFRTRRQQHGFRAAGAETAILPNGTDLNSLELTPRIGMSDVGLIDEPGARRRYSLPDRPPLPRLTDIAATAIAPGGDGGWTTADITVSTTADQTPIAPGRRVSDRLFDGRRVARFVSDAPIKNFFSIQSARYAVERRTEGGVDYAVYHHPAHAWNVDRMLTAMRASIRYYSQAFGPYQFRQMRIVERPDNGGGQAFPNTIAVGEGVFPMDLRDPATLDMVSMLAAHEVAHQWWGHQVLGARMQGAPLLTESLAQYSALMVMKRLRGEQDVRSILRFQLDRYLSGRRTSVLAEQPLVSVGMTQDDIAYGKGALALYALQRRIGEAAVNRALRRFVARYRFGAAPFPRSLDLIGFLRAEARTPGEQALITDLFERITLYDLRVDRPTAARRRDGRWDVTVPVVAAKSYADGHGNARQVPLDEPVELELVTALDAPSDRRQQAVVVTRAIRSGRQVLRFVTDHRPIRATIDPNVLQIDRDQADNAAPVAG